MTSASAMATEPMFSPANQATWFVDLKKVSCPLRVGGECLPQVEKFKYFGVLFSSGGRMEHEIDRRISAASAVMQSPYRTVVVPKDKALDLPVNQTQTQIKWKKMRAGCESVCAVLTALDLLGLQLREEVGVLVELSQLSRDSGDPQTCSVVQSLLLSPHVERLKQFGDLLSNARGLGCTADTTGHFGEYLLNKLHAELKG